MPNLDGADSFEEAEEIINDSDESVDDLAVYPEEELTADTEQYDESDEDAADEYEDEGDPEELNFEPDVEGEPEDEDAV